MVGTQDRPAGLSQWEANVARSLLRTVTFLGEREDIFRP